MSISWAGNLLKSGKNVARITQAMTKVISTSKAASTTVKVVKAAGKEGIKAAVDIKAEDDGWNAKVVGREKKLSESAVDFVAGKGSEAGGKALGSILTKGSQQTAKIAGREAKKAMAGSSRKQIQNAVKSSAEADIKGTAKTSEVAADVGTGIVGKKVKK